eukprot:COSAG02_NODE_1569_length_11894_cov_51.145994_2_plen_45_part_00
MASEHNVLNRRNRRLFFAAQEIQFNFRIEIRNALTAETFRNPTR